MSYDTEKEALELVLTKCQSQVSTLLNDLTLQELNNLADALDELAVIVDTEAIQRIHNPKESDMRS